MNRSVSQTMERKEQEEEGPLRGDGGAAGAGSTPPSADHNRPDDDEGGLPPPSPPPPLAPPHFCSLPDIAHDAIAPYLIVEGMHCMMESSLRLLKAYGERVKEVKLLMPMQGCPLPTLLPIISRRPNLTHITTAVDNMMSVVAEAMRRGYLDKLQALKIQFERQPSEEAFGDIAALCFALADGLCPKLSSLVVPGGSECLLTFPG